MRDVLLLLLGCPFLQIVFENEKERGLAASPLAFNGDGQRTLGVDIEQELCERTRIGSESEFIFGSRQIGSGGWRKRLGRVLGCRPGGRNRRGIKTFGWSGLIGGRRR